jgi:hypothetical protein
MSENRRWSLSRCWRTVGLVSAVVLVSVAAGCGGSQSPASTPEPARAVAPVVEPVVAAPSRAATPEAPEYVFHIYWDGIHVLTVYPVPGLVRSEERSGQSPPYGEYNEYFSIISHYYEREDLWVEPIEAATSVENLLDRLRAIELVEVDEEENLPQSL